MTKSKVLSFLLVLAMLFTMLPVNAFAAESTAETALTTEPKIAYEQLRLGDSLTMYFYISAEESTNVNVTMGSFHASYDLSTMQTNGDGYYEIAVDLAAAQMTEKITLDLLQNEICVLQKTYTVRDYAVAILENNYPEFTKNLVKWMLGYGAAAQQYFGINTDNYANAGYEQDATTLPEDYAETSISGCVDGIQFYGASLVFDKQVAVRYYFTADSAEGMTFTANGTPYEAVQKNNMYCVEVPGINPQQYAESIELTVTKGEEALKVSYCPMNYIIRMSEKSSTSESLKALLNAMYGYHTAAVTFVTQEAYEITLGDLSQMQLSEGEEATAVELTATAGNGNVVRYAAVSGDEDVATVSISGDTLTVTPVAMGKSTIPVTANADGCESAEQAFELTVMKDVLHYKADGTAYEDGVTIEAWEDSSAGWDHAGSTYKTYIGSATGAFVGDFTVCVNYNTKAHKTVSGNSGYTTRVYMHDYSNSAAYWIFNIPWTSADKANNSVLGSPTSTATTTIPSKEAAIDIFKDCDIALTIKRQGTVVSWVANVTAGEGTSYAGQTFTTQFTLTGVTSEILQLGISNRAFSEYTVQDIKICGKLYDPLSFDKPADLIINEDAQSEAVTLNASTANGKQVSFTAVSDDENVAKVSLEGNRLTVTPVAMGKTTVTVVANAENSQSVEHSFTVTVMQDVLHYKADGTAFEDGTTIEAWEDSTAGWDHAGPTYKTYIGSPEGAFVGDFTISMRYNIKAQNSAAGKPAYTARFYIHDYENPAAYYILNLPWNTTEVANAAVMGSPTKEITTTIPSSKAAVEIIKNCDIQLSLKREGVVVCGEMNITAGEGTTYAGQTFTTQFTFTGVTSESLQFALSNRGFTDYTIQDIKICGDLYDPNVREGAWQEKDGKVVIPASAAAEMSTYASYSSVNEYDTWAKYTDGQLEGIIQNSTNGTTWTNMNTAFYNAPQVHYTFNVTNPGRYYLYLLTSYPDLSGNSIYAFMDTDRALIKCATEDYGEGLWLSDASWYFDIDEAGEHTITICAREDGVILNQIMLSQNSAETVTNGVEQTVSMRNSYEIHSIFKEENGDVTIDLATAFENSEYAYTTVGHAGDATKPYRWERSTGLNGVQVYPDTGVVWGTKNVSPKLSYQVEFTTPGEYYVMLYSSYKDTNSDSVYVSVDNGDIVACASQIAKGPEKWNGNVAWKITIPEAGVHTINVYPREDGCILHQMRLVQNPESVETLVIGDSYTGKYCWKNLDQQIASIDGQSIGIGGTVVSLWMNNVEELKFYNPKNLVIHIGINDLNSGTSGTDCGNSVVALLEALQAALPDTKIFYVSISNATKYEAEWEDYAVSNQIVQDYIQSAESNLYFIDFASVMNVEGPSMTNSGFTDGLHLNDEGYVLFSQMICDAVLEANQG